MGEYEDLAEAARASMRSIKPHKQVTWSYAFTEKRLQIEWNQLYLSVNALAHKNTPEKVTCFMGTLRLCLCGGSSTKQILQTVHSPPAFLSRSTLFVPSHFIQTEGGDCSQSHWANSGGRSIPSLLCSQENPPFYFFIWAPSCQAEPRVWCQKAELIALSQRGKPPIAKPGLKCFTGDY